MPCFWTSTAAPSTLPRPALLRLMAMLLRSWGVGCEFSINLCLSHSSTTYNCLPGRNTRRAFFMRVAGGSAPTEGQNLGPKRALQAHPRKYSAQPVRISRSGVHEDHDDRFCPGYHVKHRILNPTRPGRWNSQNATLLPPFERRHVKPVEPRCRSIWCPDTEILASRPAEPFATTAFQASTRRSPSKLGGVVTVGYESTVRPLQPLHHELTVPFTSYNRPVR